jgi:hypothetical protein
MAAPRDVPSPLLTPELAALRARLDVCVVLDLVLLVLVLLRVLLPGRRVPLIGAEAAGDPVLGALALGAMGTLLVMGLAIQGGPRRYLDLVPWYAWAHAAAAGIAGMGILTGASRGAAAWFVLIAGSTVASATLERYRPAGVALWRERDVETRRWGGWTFERLAGASPGVLATVVGRGLGPVPRDLVGWEYKSHHLHPLARLLRVDKSTVGFFRAPGSPDVEGFRLPTLKDGLERPWQTLPGDRYGFLVATPADVEGRDRHPTTTALDYRESRRNPSGDWLRHRLTYLVMANSGDPALLVGRVYGRLGRLQVPMGHVVLERWREHDYTGPGAAL